MHGGGGGGGGGVGVQLFFQIYITVFSSYIKLVCFHA